LTRVIPGLDPRRPRPEFIVLYNGTEEAPDRWEERLSDALMEAAGETNPSLDLTIVV
jgi:hypothetical protein